MKRLRELGVKGTCFNLEVWDPIQFERVYPGKHAIVGRDRWLESLEDAVDVFGRGHVMVHSSVVLNLWVMGFVKRLMRLFKALLSRASTSRSAVYTRSFHALENDG